MFPELTPLKQPIALRTEYLVDKTTRVRIQQHGKALSSGKFTVFGSDGHVAGHQTLGPEADAPSAERQRNRALIEVDGKYMSPKTKRAFRDASGLPLFDLSRKYLGTTWCVKLPGGNGPPIARIAPHYSLLKVDLDIYVKNAAANGQEVLLKVKGQDNWQLRTNIYFGDQVVMTTKLTDKLAGYLPRRRCEWDVDIVKGMDLSLASVIVVLLGAMMYGDDSFGPIN